MTPLHEFKGLRLPETKKPYVLTIVGSDRPGVVAALSSTLAEHHCNIERIKMIARGEFLAMEMWIDLREANFSLLRQDLTAVAKKIGMDIIAQPEHVFKIRKKVIVFDMDSTIVDGEIIDEMARLAGVGKKVATITEKGMQGEIGFSESLRTRVSLLKGLRIKSLESIAKTVNLTQGSEELDNTAGTQHAALSDQQSTLSTQPSTIRITRPDSGTVYRLTPQTPSETLRIPVQAIAADGVRLRSLSLLVDGQSIGAFTTSPARTFWRLQPGAHTITARLVDEQGQAFESEPVRIVVTQ